MRIIDTKAFPVNDAPAIDGNDARGNLALIVAASLLILGVGYLYVRWNDARSVVAGDDSPTARTSGLDS